VQRAYPTQRERDRLASMRLACLALAVAVVFLGAADTAAAAGWLRTPVVLSPRNANHAVEDLAMAPDGTTFVAYGRFGATTSSEVAVRPPGGPFGQPFVIGTGTTSFGTSLAVDPGNNAIAVWRTGDGIRAAHRPAGGEFQALPPVANGMIANAPFVEFTSTGDAIAVWSRAGVLETAVRKPGESFGSVTPIPGAGPSTTMSLDTDSAGNAAVVFIDQSGGNERAMLSFRPAGGAFSPAVVLASVPASQDCGSPIGNTSTNHLGLPRVALDAQQGTQAVWSLSSNKTSCTPASRDVSIHARARTAAGALSPASPQTLDSFQLVDPSTDSLFFPAIAFDRGGDAVVQWGFRRSGSPNAVRWSARAPGGSFGPAADLASSIGDSAPQTFSSLTTLAGGDVMSVFARQRIVQSATRSPGGAFGPIADVAVHDSDSLVSPRVAADGLGDAAAAWSRSSPSEFVVEVTHYDASPPQFGPVDVPAAALAGAPVTMSAAGSDALSAVSTSWSFGDGGVADGAQVSHAYAAPGRYEVRVTLTDGAGNTASTTRSIEVAGPETTVAADVAAPGVSGYRVGASRFTVTGGSTPVDAVAAAVPRGTRFTYTLSEAARARLTIARAEKGVRVGSACRKRTRRLLAQLRKKKQRIRSCTRYVRAGVLTRTSHQGANRVAFSGRIGKRALKPARYRTTLVATDAAGNASAPRNVTFTIVPAKRR
jgi:chitodextrinase